MRLLKHIQIVLLAVAISCQTYAQQKENSEKLTTSDKELTRKWDLPEDVIARTPTDKLFLHFINSPLVAMLMIYDSPEPGVKRLLNSSTTLHEFYTRDDMAEGALKMYVEYDLSPESVSDETIKEKFSRDPRIRDNPEIQERLAPDKIVNMKIAHVTLQIMHADETLLTSPFFPKLKGHEKEFMAAFLKRYEKITELQKKYGEDFSPAFTCLQLFCVRLAENLDKDFYNKLKNIKPVGEGMKQFFDEIKKYLEKSETGKNNLQVETLLSSVIADELNPAEPNKSVISKPVLIVSPTYELDKLIENYEKGRDMTEQQKKDFEQLKEQLLNARKSGQTRWNSQNWMKAPNYYKNLDTLKLAEECFSGSLFANEISIHNDPAVGLENLKIFHNGFAELVNREDMWKGILHIYDVLSLKLDTKADLRQIVDASGQLDQLLKLYGLSPLREQVKGKEKLFLAANSRSLKKFVWYLENYDSEKMGGSPGFFCEPCTVAQVALMLAKQVNPKKYAEIITPVTSVRWTQEQKVPELKAFIELVISSLDGFVTQTDVVNLY